MKTQLPSAIILCALLLVLSLHAFAAGNQTTHVSSSGTSHRASNASALLANALGTRYTGYTITIQPTGDLRLSQTGAPATAPVYPEEDLYWLSRAIYSESGNQPMAGRIAVGTVILNRVADPAFPDTIKDVVFAPRQFSPVANGTIYHDPDERSVVAAKLCLDGVREAEPCLYFNVTTMYSWADRSRTYYCTIGGHNFYL